MPYKDPIKAKESARINGRKYRARNLEKCRAAVRRSYKKHLPKSRQYGRDWMRRYRILHREKANAVARRWCQKNREKCRIKNNLWQKKNADWVRKYHSRYASQRRQNDPQFRIMGRLRTRLYQALKGCSALKSGNTKKLLGCSVEQLRYWLESLFISGMSWSNYGEWHVDHERPCARFDLTKPSQQKKCFHYTNLRPLWAKDNLSKGAKIYV